MDINLFWIGAGLAALGYFIGDGLKNFKNPKASVSDYPVLIKETELYYHLGLSREETAELLAKYPGAPKIELEGTAYFQYQHIKDWLSSNHFDKK
jgi:hypothetical protein